MDTKAKITEQIIRKLSGGDDNGRWDRREIMLALCQQRDYLAKAAYWEAMGQGEKDIDETWLSVYENQPTVYDTATGMWYVQLPATPIVLPKGKGINTVSFMKALFDPMIPMSNTAPWLLKEAGTMTVDLLGSTGYFQQGDRLYLVGFNGQADILIKMIANSSSLGEHDYFPCAPDVIKNIVDYVFASYSPAQQKPLDTSNNKTPN